MSKHDNDTCPHLVRASLLEAENARLKAEVETLKLGSLLTAVDVMAFIKLKEENSRLKEDVEMWKLRSDNWQKLCQMSKEGKPSV